MHDEAGRVFVSQVMQKPDILAETVVKPEMLHDVKGRKIYTIAQALYLSGYDGDLTNAIIAKAPDLIADALEYEAIAASSANWKWYENEIVQRWKKKQLINSLHDIINKSEKEDAVEIESEIADVLVSLEIEQKSKPGKVADYVKGYIELLEKRQRREIESGISTGFEKFDDVTGGLKPGRLYVIGARPSQGKTALALNILSNLAIKGDRRVGLITLESSMDEIMDRLFIINTGMQSNKLVNGIFSPADYHKLLEFSAKIYDKNTIYYYEKPGANLGECVTALRTMKKRDKIECAIIDYAQLVRVPGKEDRRSEAEEVSLTIKQVARELEIPIILLAQLKRDVDNRRPHMGDFQWSSQYEQDADVAALIYHDYKKGDTYHIEASYLMLDKVRDGRRCIIDMKYDGERLTFVEKDAVAKLPD